MRKTENWRLVEMPVNINRAHIRVSCGESTGPMVLLAKSKGRTIRVEYLLGSPMLSNKAKEALDFICRDVEYYLIDKQEKNAWGYAIYHSCTMANICSKVHWVHFPNGCPQRREFRPRSEIQEPANRPLENKLGVS